MTQEWIAQYLGRLMSRYAQVEEELRRVLLVQSGVDERIFMALVEFPQTRAAVNKLRNLLQGSSLEERARKNVDGALTHLDLITKLRNDIVHYGLLPSTKAETVVLQHKPKRVIVTQWVDQSEITYQQLDSAIADLGRIQTTLWYYLNPSPFPQVLRSVEKIATREEPWLYKPPPRRHDRK